jgi:FkbH-like protein
MPPKAGRQGPKARLAEALGALADNPELQAAFPGHNGAHFLAPTDLGVTDVAPRRVAMVGSCFLAGLNLHTSNPSGCEVDLFVANNATQLKPLEPGADGALPYDFQIVQIGLRHVLRDATFWRLPYDDPAPFAQALRQSCRLIDFALDRRMAWNTAHGLLTFVANFMCPQRNPMGMLFPRFDLRNPEFFVEKLNEHLEKAVQGYRNAYILDLDRMAQSFGRRYAQDDVVAVLSHNALLAPRQDAAARIEPIPNLMLHYPATWPKEWPEAVWRETMAMYRVVRQADSVKMVVVDLDDTLWSGVIGEMAEIDAGILAGWQIGFAEALMWLKKRGILLAILSKNEESRIREVFPKVFGDTMQLDDFAAVRINWLPKAENMREVLQAVNLLPRSVVFIDDNPAERSAMQQAFPDMRILGRNPFYLRQTLLWAPETQVAAVSAESAKRTEMIQAQLQREDDRKAVSADEFLRAAAPVVTLGRIDGVHHARFGRASELVNKTNQFNTTGKRWQAAEFTAFFARGGQMHVFEVQDSYTAYGLVGVVLIEGGSIVQWVMSCRVLGYQIENAVMAVLITAMRAGGAARVAGQLVETDANFPCRDLFEKCGFVLGGNSWVLGADVAVEMPAHVTVVV